MQGLNFHSRPPTLGNDCLLWLELLRQFNSYVHYTKTTVSLVPFTGFHAAGGLDMLVRGGQRAVEGEWQGDYSIF